MTDHHAPTAAQDFLLAAADAIQQRAEQRDHADGERSIPRAVAMFNELTGHRLTQREGWVFMALLKLSRAQGGRYHADDYVDATGYLGLAGEAAGEQARAAVRNSHPPGISVRELEGLAL